MCKLAIQDGVVDLDSCPLLAGLTPEQRRAKARDPRLQACMSRALDKAARKPSSEDPGPTSCLDVVSAVDAAPKFVAPRASARRTEPASQ